MRNWFFIAAMPLVLAGCATTANYEAMLNSWMGLPEVELVSGWGPPIQAYEVGGKKFLTYSSQRNVYVPGVAPTLQTTFVGNTAYTSSIGGSPSQNIGLACRTTFEIQYDKVRSWKYEGNDCKALPRGK